MLLDIIAYGILAAAIGIVLWRLWHRVQGKKHSKCAGCPLADNCVSKKTSNTCSKNAKSCCQ